MLSNVGGTSAWLNNKGVADNGLIAVLRTLETCRSYDIYRNRATKQIDLRRRNRRALHRQLFAGNEHFDPLSYYWTSEQTEWATDIAFRDPSSLADLYPSLIHRGMKVFQSPDVMRFLGHKLPAHGAVHGKYAGEVVSDLKRHPEDVRLKHRAGRNTVKMYDKLGSVLRVETTLNDPKGLKVYRTKQNDPDGPKDWWPLRKSVADLSRRTELSQKSNDRYIEGLSAFDCDEPLKKLTDKVYSRVQVGKRWQWVLRPFDPTEVKLN
ncbi:MAG: hypothetical protein R3C05_31900 [Pirellulaceae bacterium]